MCARAGFLLRAVMPAVPRTMAAPASLVAVALPTVAGLSLLQDPILCMNRNRREPKKANHGARPCSNRRRRRLKRLRRSPG